MESAEDGRAKFICEPFFVLISSSAPQLWIDCTSDWSISIYLVTQMNPIDGLRLLSH